jgi:signal transduction histidine kinase
LAFPVSLLTRRNLLFFCALTAACSSLLLLGIRTLRQDEELARQSAGEEKSRAIDLARQELVTRLETIKLRATAGQVFPDDPEVALVAVVRSGRFLGPWEQGEGGGSAAARKNLNAAAVLAREGHSSEAFTASRRLLRLPAKVTDEYGIPLALYAARLLAASESPADQREIACRIEQDLETVWLAPAALYMTADLPNLDSRLRKLARARAAEMEEAAKLVDVPVLEHGGASPFWLLAGNAPWLISVAGPREDSQRTVVAVRAHPVLDSLKLPGQSRWVVGQEPGSQSLGEGFSGLRIAIELETRRPPSRRWFYIAAALLVTLMIFSAWLLNRDVQREARLALLRSQFVSSVSHELKTPIATIGAYAELIDMGRVPESEVSRYLKTILGETQRLSRLVEGVLAFSKAEQGNRLYRFQSISLESVVRSAAQAIQYPLEEGAFILHLAIEPGLPRVNADDDAIEQAVVNLLDNAIKYSGDRREIELSLRRDGNDAVICVRDRGIGIAPEEQSRIFEKFYRAPLADRRYVPGTGLGLALVDHVVKAHRGRVAVESELGHGSTFSILLPLWSKA